MLPACSVLIVVGEVSSDETDQSIVVVVVVVVVVSAAAAAVVEDSGGVELEQSVAMVKNWQKASCVTL
jgi:hypothetical protein